MTPVTGRIPDRQKYRLVLTPGAGERLVTPRIPIDRILGVLQQVGTRLPSETISHGASWTGVAFLAANGGNPETTKTETRTTTFLSP